jgi:hypothetical protein
VTCTVGFPRESRRCAALMDSMDPGMTVARGVANLVSNKVEVCFERDEGTPMKVLLNVQFWCSYGHVL